MCEHQDLFIWWNSLLIHRSGVPRLKRYLIFVNFFPTVARLQHAEAEKKAGAIFYVDNKMDV